MDIIQHQKSCVAQILIISHHLLFITAFIHFLFFLSSCRKLNLVGTAVSLKPLTRLLKACHTLEHLNLASCRGLPRGIKRLYSNREAIVQLRNDIVDGKFNKCDDDDDDD